MAETDEAYRLTVKGWLAVHSNFSDELWDELVEFVKQQAIRDGCVDGVPVLIFDGGGVCRTAIQENNDAK